MGEPTDDLDAALGALVALHREVDARVAEVAARHGARLRCTRGCAACCVDGLTVFEIEAERIRRSHAQLLRGGELHPAGGCALLDAGGACRIYPDRPYVCRTQGLPLRWLEERDDGEIVERRDICPENLAGRPLAALADEDQWLLGPTEGRLAAIQARADGGRLRRVALRSLFRRGRPEQ